MITSSGYVGNMACTAKQQGPVVPVPPLPMRENREAGLRWKDGTVTVRRRSRLPGAFAGPTEEYRGGSGQSGLVQAAYHFAAGAASAA